MAARARWLAAVDFGSLTHGRGTPIDRLWQLLDIRRRNRRRCTEDPFEYPCTAQHRRRAVRIRGQHQHRAFAEQAMTLRILQSHLPKATALDVLDAIEERKLFVDISVIGGQEVHDTAV